MKRPVPIYIALGTNLGDRVANLSLAVEYMHEQIEVLASSTVYETPPWGIIDQPRFLNQVIHGKTWLTPTALLDFLKETESRMGRVASMRFGPRLIDLDILLYGRRQVCTSRLRIPHPRMHERAFVLVPLNEIAPGLVIPGTGQRIDLLLQDLDTRVILPYKDPSTEV